MKDVDRFWFFDATFMIGATAAGGTWTAKNRFNVRWDVHNLVMQVLGRQGFNPVVDQTARGCIRRYCRYGRWGDLEVATDVYCTGMKVEFFQNLVHKNPNGGRYDFNRRSKMPYIVRLRFCATIRKLKAALLAKGFVDASDPQFVGLEQILWNRARNSHVQDAAKQPDYNVRDADGVRMNDGDVRWARDSRGYLLAGRAYYNINSMWWLLMPGGRLHNLSSQQFFTFDASRHPRKQHPRAEQSVRGHLQKAVNAGEFERAIGLRDRLRALTNNPAYPLEYPVAAVG